MKGFRLLLALALGVSGASAQTIRLTVPAAPIAVPSVPPILSPAFAPAPSAAYAPALSPVSAAPVISLSPVPALAAAQAAPAPAADEAGAGDYGALFDGSPLEGKDGDSVGPRLLGLEQAGLRLPLQAAVVRAAVEQALPALRESVALGSWSGPHTTLDESCCGDAAPKLAALLRARGIPARLVEAEFHYYVILDLPEGQLVVDPTIRQFFGKKGAPRGVPAVFVGTIGQLTELFRRYAAAKTTRYDVPRIYFSEARTREGYLRQVESDIRAGGPRDLEPLRRHLGLPPAPPTKPEPPRLIVP